MKQIGWAAIAASLLVSPCLAADKPAEAPKPGDALKAFGLPGTWSPSCSRAEHETWSPDAGCPTKIVFATPENAAPNVSIVTCNKLAAKMEIPVAEQQAADRIRMVYAVKQVPGDKTFLKPGDSWEIIYVKKDDKIKMMSEKQVGTSRTLVSDGKQAGRETQLLEKCGG